MISFNNVPTSIRTPGVYTEVDPSRALKGLVQNPHRALIIGQRDWTVSTIEPETLIAITNDSLADGYFGVGSQLALMCNKFKKNNPNTELQAMALSEGTTYKTASCSIQLSEALNDAAASVAGTWYLMINGEKCYVYISIGDLANQIASDLEAIINSNDNLPCRASASGWAAASGGHLMLEAKWSGITGSHIDIRDNYYQGQVVPSCFSTNSTPIQSNQTSALNFHGGAGAIDLDDAWAVIANDQFHYVIQPANDATNLTSIEGELEDRFLPLNDLQGHGFTGARNTHTLLANLGNGRNSPHNTIIGAAGFPQLPEEWASALGAVAAWNLNIDPARPLHFLKLKGLLPPKIEDRFSRAERDLHLYDGIATHIVDTGGNVLIERCITTYQKTALNTLDPTFLDVQTVATLGEIRYQYKAKMERIFLIPRFKLADDTFPVTPGSKVATPSIVKMEIISLFTLLRDRGIIENLDQFIDELIVERDITDRNRINCLLPADLINQFRILASVLQFIL